MKTNEKLCHGHAYLIKDSQGQDRQRSVGNVINGNIGRVVECLPEKEMHNKIIYVPLK